MSSAANGPHCGHPLAAESNTCADCGAETGTDESTERQGETMPAIMVWIIAVSIVAIVVMLLLSIINTVSMNGS